MTFILVVNRLLTSTKVHCERALYFQANFLFLLYFFLPLVPASRQKQSFALSTSLFIFDFYFERM